MRSSYHDRNRSTIPSVLQQQSSLRKGGSSYGQYQPVITKRSSSYHRHRRHPLQSSSYHHRHRHHPRSRNRDHRNRRYSDIKHRIHSRSRSRENKQKNKSFLAPNSEKIKAMKKLNECANALEASFNEYVKEVIVPKLNNYYDTSITPRFMIENDEKFRNRIERMKGLNAFSAQTLNNTLLTDENKSPKSEKSEKSKSKNSSKKVKKIITTQGKSSMNYKFRAFKKSNQPNSFVQTETKQDEPRYPINAHRRIRTNMHVNDEDIYIDRSMNVDMNELINGLVYSKHYQDHRIGTLNTAQNDYSQYFVDTRKRPQNFIRELPHIDRLKEYPKLRKLMQSKNEQLRKISLSTPPLYINADLKTFDFANRLKCKFDVILVDPPWQLYVDRSPGAIQNLDRRPWTFEELSSLRIQDIAENPSFLFLWCGNGKLLNDGRQLLKKWGYKRCEVIVWLKTNKKSQIKLTTAEKSDNLKDYLLEKNENGLIWNEYEGKNDINKALFVRSYEHCLMGIRGQVRRSTDGHLIHANVDTDVIITESAPYGSTQKPNELYDIIERFCLGRKRLELFGCRHNLRPGWLTISNDKGIPKNSNYDSVYYNSLFVPPNGPRYVPTTNEIEALRPKSPMRNKGNNNKHLKNGMHNVNIAAK